MLDAEAKSHDAHAPKHAETGDDREDGRVLRGKRNRAAVVDAILTLLDEGVQFPNAAQIAERAGVSTRSVYSYFNDMDTLVAAASRRQFERLAEVAEEVDASLPFAERVGRFCRQRARVCERMSPVRRVSLRLESTAPVVAEGLARARVHFRRQLESVFAAELDRMPAGQARTALDALDAITSWEAWDVLRSHQGLSAKRACETVALAVSAVLSREHEEEGP